MQDCHFLSLMSDWRSVINQLHEDQCGCEVAYTIFSANDMLVDCMIFDVFLPNRLLVIRNIKVKWRRKELLVIQSIALALHIYCRGLPYSPLSSFFVFLQQPSWNQPDLKAPPPQRSMTARFLEPTMQSSARTWNAVVFSSYWLLRGHNLGRVSQLVYTTG